MLMDEKQVRPETGPMTFGDDWTGVFIRGDNACFYSHALLKVARTLPEGFDRIQLESLARLLGSAFQGSTPSQEMRAFCECFNYLVSEVSDNDGNGKEDT
jgi:hypothetical protein